MTGKSKSRRAEIRRNRPDLGLVWQTLKAPAARGALVVGIAFWLTASGLMMLRERVVRYRPGEYVHHDVTSRVRFESRNIEQENELRQRARDATPRVYRRVDGAFAELGRRLAALPQLVSTTPGDQWPPELTLSPQSVSLLKSIAAAPARFEEYRKWIHAHTESLRAKADAGELVIIPAAKRDQDLEAAERESISVQDANPNHPPRAVKVESTFSPREQERPPAELLRPPSEPFAELVADLSIYAQRSISPTHELNPDLTAEQQKLAAARIGPLARHIVENTVLVPKDTTVTSAQWKLLSQEQRAYVAELWHNGRLQWFLRHTGLASIVLLLTAAMGAYVAYYQPRIVQNSMRAFGIACLLLAMLLVAQLAGVGTAELLLFGIAPTLLVAIILSIAYDQRFAMSIATLHGLLVTVGLGQSISFFLIIWPGVLASCFLLDDLRTRSKLIEVGAFTSLAMMLAAAAIGFVDSDPLTSIGKHCLYVGAAGLGVGFIVLGILPFVEKTFRITTSMTLLEWADVNQPLLRRLAMEAPGTYNHSLQVATLAEAAAESIGANALLCRVGSYYHDIGKVNKTDYFCENQFDGQNRHINLTPNVSLLIITGHVKDGVELAREYRLPSVLTPFIAEHHGTTLVEHFYNEARKQTGDSDIAVSDSQYRYPGPRPRTRESVIVMISDIVESAARSMVEPTANRIEQLVHELIMKRLLDGQFEDADLTFGELETVERSVVKTLVGIYHGRLSYPSTEATTSSPGGTGGPPATRSA